MSKLANESERSQRKPLTAEADPGDLGIMGDPDDRGQEWDGGIGEGVGGE